MRWFSKVRRLCSCYRAGLPWVFSQPARRLLSGPVFILYLSPLYERPTRLLPAVCVASIHRTSERSSSQKLGFRHLSFSETQRARKEPGLLETPALSDFTNTEKLGVTYLLLCSL